MRIVIDLQGAQTDSRLRGIGRAALSLSKAIARLRGDDEIIIALNGLLPEAIADLRQAFAGVLPESNVLVWKAQGPTRDADAKNLQRRQAAEIVREAFLADLDPDVVLVTSFFEGLGDNAIASIDMRLKSPTAIILHDLIPLLNPDAAYRRPGPHRDWYRRKLNQFRHADLLLAVSESARREAIHGLGFDPASVVAIANACDPVFQPRKLSDRERLRLWAKHGISRPFVMYTGGADERKNLDRLMGAFAALPVSLRRAHQLVMVGRMPQPELRAFIKSAKRVGLTREDLVFTGYVEDEDLVRLYNTCALFAFPSLHEGFGIPPLEAMACGAPVIAADATSLPEVVGLDEALFDPTSVAAIAGAIERGLTDADFRARLIAHGTTQARRFSWDASARATLDALRRFDRSADAPRAAAHITIERSTRIERRPLRILLLKLDHLGDFLLAAPAMRKLAARYPGAAIDIMIGSWNMANAQALGLFRKIHVFDFLRRGQNLDSVKRSEIPAGVKAGLDYYDIAIDLRRHADTRWVLTEIGAELKVGYQSFDAEIDRQLDIVASADRVIRGVRGATDLTPAPVQMAQLVEMLPSRLDDYLTPPAPKSPPAEGDLQIAFFPKAGHDGKEWEAARFAALAQRLAERADVAAVNFYCANAAEAADAPAATDKIRIHVGLSWEDLQKALAANAICLANNSGGAHLAAWLGLTVLAIISGHDLAAEWAPVFGDHAIYSDTPCAPCHLSQRSLCPFDVYCLESISVDDVYGRLVEAIERIGALRAGETRVGPTIGVKLSPDVIMRRLIEALAAIVGQWPVAEQASLARAIAHNHPRFAAAPEAAPK